MQIFKNLHIAGVKKVERSGVGEVDGNTLKQLKKWNKPN
jgi:hypothetical protein